MTIKGPLGLLVWADTLNDDMCVKPLDLIMLDNNKEKEIEPVKEQEPLVLIAA